MILKNIEQLLKEETAGDPMTGLKWTRKTKNKIACELRSLGIRVGRTTVGRLLHQIGYSLKVNRKMLGSSHPNRNQQFIHIGEQKKKMIQQGVPVISVDAKKKEMVGRFKNAGSVWVRDPVLVNDHDFPSEAVGMARPYGIYDLQANRGSVFVGTSRDTPEFAVDSIAQWWKTEGCRRYAGQENLFILADSGGSNSCRARVWKWGIQNKVCNPFGLTVTVAHYPTGASKWNPIEHRLFSQISKNWAGRPLDSYETVLNYICTTKTSTGLTSKATLLQKDYQIGKKVSDEDWRTLHIQHHTSLPDWNYTLMPARRT